MSPEEQSRPDHIPSLEVVNTAYSEIVAHNKRHTGMGVGFGNIFQAIIEADNPISDDPNDPQPLPAEDIYAAVNEKMKQSTTEGDMHGELQEMLHEDTFMRIGIKMGPFGNHMVNGLGERTTSTALVPLIENTELFKDFLATVSPEEVAVDAEDLLPSAVLGNLRKTVATCFDPEQLREAPELQEAATQVGEDALRTFLELEPEYKRLGLDSESLRAKLADIPEGTGLYERVKGRADNYATMQGYVEYWGRDLLPEFIEADKGQYLKKPEDQGFGPASWHYDGGQRYWGPALEFVAALGQEDRTKEFGEEVRQGLVHSLDTGIKEIDDGVRIDGSKQIWFSKQRNDLVNVKNALTGQEFDAERLAQYIRDPYADPK